VYDPAQADELLKIHRVRMNWAGLDNEVNYPVLNVLKRWLDESRMLAPETVDRSKQHSSDA
jgi:hypothetical protein